MKTKDLIKRLQDADPTGEVECCIGNADICDVYSQKANWDGCLQVLVRDESGRIVSGKYTSKGVKISIYPICIRDMILEYDDFPVEFDLSGQHYIDRYSRAVTKYREESIRINHDVELSVFIQYMHRRLSDQYGEDFDNEEVVAAATEFYNSSLSFRDEIPGDLVGAYTEEVSSTGDKRKTYLSYNNKRSIQWNRELVVDFVDGKIKIRKL